VQIRALLKNLCLIASGAGLAVAVLQLNSPRFEWVPISVESPDGAFAFVSDEYLDRTKSLPETVALVGDWKVIQSRDSATNFELGYRTKIKIDGVNEWESESPSNPLTNRVDSCSSAEVSLELKLLDRDRFVLGVIESENFMLNWGKEGNFQAIAKPNIARHIAERVTKVSARLRLLRCFTNKTASSANG